MRDVIEINDRSEFACLDELARRRVVRREHDVLARDADAVAENHFGKTGTVAAEAFFFQDLENMRVGRSFDGEEFFKSLAPIERRDQSPCVLANAPFVVNVERRGMVLRNLANGLFIERQRFGGHW